MSYAPPAYAHPSQPKVYGTSPNDPLLASSSGPPARNRWDDEGEEAHDADDDFKVGVTVAQCSKEVRDAFVRKVYSVLFVQIAASAVVGWLMSTDAVKGYVRENSWLVITSMVASFGSMLAVYWKRHSSPLNLILLGAFTVFEATTVGYIASYYSQMVVLQALVITAILFFGLTLFTFQSRIDFSGMGSYLFAGLLVFFMTGVVGIFLPYSRTLDMIIAGAGCLLFSAYIIYDTHMLLNRLSPDEWVLACVSLYLDVINLFLQVLRLLNDSNESN